MNRQRWERIRPYGNIAFALGLDTTEMQWANLNCDLLLKIDDSECDLKPDGRRKVLDEIERTAVNVAGAFAETMSEGAEHFERLAHHAGSDRLFPWLPSPGADRGLYFQKIADSGFLSNVLDIHRPLTGQVSLRLGEVVGVIKLIPGPALGTAYRFSSPDDPSFGIVLGVIEIDAISFWDGSWFSWLNVRAAVLGLALQLFALQPFADLAKEGMDHARLHANIAKALRNQPMVEARAFHFPESELRDQGIKILNYGDDKLSPEERRERVAIVQLALKVALGTELAIDGNAGPETGSHLRQFARSRNLPTDINNPFLRAELFKVLAPQTWLPW